MNSITKSALRLRHLPLQQALQVLALFPYSRLAPHFPSGHVSSPNETEIERWFGTSAPTLYHSGFGREFGGSDEPAMAPRNLVDATLFRRDPRLQWEATRDQDLSAIARQALAAGPSEAGRALVADRLQRFLFEPSPNAMEASLRCVSWLEALRFFVPLRLVPDPTLQGLAEHLLQLGSYIERRFYEVPLGGNHHLAHAVGLLYLGRLLPGRTATDRWARRGYSVLSKEIRHQFRDDGGSYEQSTAYHLFSLDLVLGATLLLAGHGIGWPPEVRERIHRAAQFVAALLRPDASIPILGDDDSGRLHRWGNDAYARELCALSALLFDDPGLAIAANGASSAISWLLGHDSGKRLEQLRVASSELARSNSFESTGLHVIADGSECHAILWSRDPSPPSMVAHAHSDQNSIDVWMSGQQVLRDPGTGVYLGNPDLRNQLRATAAHTTLTLDGVEINPFAPDDLFFVPPVTRGRRCGWLSDAFSSTVTTTHDGFRRLEGQPQHFRTLYLDCAAKALTVVDQVAEEHRTAKAHLIEAWWQWGTDPHELATDDEEGFTMRHLSLGAVQVQLYLPSGAEFVLRDVFPWSPAYGTVLAGRRSIVRYQGVLPFLMILRLAYSNPVQQPAERGH